MANAIKGMVADIQRFVLHDGPGIRTTVFLKGCSLRCYWCHNPETWTKGTQIRYFIKKCINCGVCLEVCEQQTSDLTKIRPGLFPEKCTLCGACIKSCYAGAREISGKEYTSDELLSELIKDKVYFEHSGGGITLSGGEPLFQADFCYDLLLKCKEANLKTAIETSAFGNWDDLVRLLPLLDLVIMDIKHLDNEKHIMATGVSNKINLENAIKIAASGIPLIIRTPVIPGFNDNEEAIAGIAEFIKNFPDLQYYELLPYHSFGSSKFVSLGFQNTLEIIAEPSSESMMKLAETAGKQGVKDVKIA